MSGHDASINEMALKDFETAWRSEGVPNLLEFLPDQSDESYQATCEELVLIDIEFRWKRQTAGVEALTIQSYLDSLPHLKRPDFILNLIEQEWFSRCAAGDRPDIQEYASQFPDVISSMKDLPGSCWNAQVTEVERPGTTIGAYKLNEVIGEGGFGTVYLAQQSEPVQREVALKIVKPGMDSREVVARFEAERQALALMDHPGIAQVFDAGTTASGRPYFVMELVRSTDF